MYFPQHRESKNVFSGVSQLLALSGIHESGNKADYVLTVDFESFKKRSRCMNGSKIKPRRLQAGFQVTQVTPGDDTDIQRIF